MTRRQDTRSLSRSRRGSAPPTGATPPVGLAAYAVAMMIPNDVTTKAVATQLHAIVRAGSGQLDALTHTAILRALRLDVDALQLDAATSEERSS